MKQVPRKKHTTLRVPREGPALRGVGRYTAHIVIIEDKSDLAGLVCHGEPLLN